MLGLTTGRYSVMRGSTLNEYDDEVDGDTIVVSGLLGSVIERTRQVFNPDDSRVATVRFLVGRFNYNADIQDGDRLKDDKTGEVYVVASVSRGSNAVNKSSLELELTVA